MAAVFSDVLVGEVPATLTSVYTCQAAKAIMIHGQIANNSQSIVYATVVKSDYSNSNAQGKLAYNLEIPPGVFLCPIEGSLVLSQGDQILAMGSVAGALSFSLSFMEMS